MRMGMRVSVIASAMPPKVRAAAAAAASSAASASASVWRAQKDGVAVMIRLTPNAARDAITGATAGDDGALVVTASVTAPPDKGKANAALIKLLADEWSIPRSTLSISAGSLSRNKVVHVQGDPTALLARLPATIG